MTDPKVTRDAPEPDLLRRELELCNRAMDATSCGISIADAQRPDLPLVYVNDAFERLTGFAREEVLGKNCRFLQGRERDAGKVLQIRRALQNGECLTVLLRNFRKDGAPFWNELTLSPIRDARGTLSHYVGIQTDVTERETAKAALVTSNGRLEDANANLQRLNDDKDRLLGLAAHDVRSPLSAVHSLLELALESDDRAQRDELLRMSLDTTHGALQLLNDLLDVTAIRTGKLNIVRQPVDLGSYFEHIARTCRQFAAPKRIEFVMRTQFARPTLALDPKRISQVVTNLMGNAVKFSEGGTRVTLSVTSDADGLELEIADQGRGIPEAELPLLFREFSQTSTRPTGNESGSGLGLSICKRLVELHGGEISVASKEGEGTRFKMLLPAL